MNVYGHVSALQALCKATGKHGLYLSLPPWTEEWDYWPEIMKAIKFLGPLGPQGFSSDSDLDGEIGQALCDGHIYILVDSADERDDLYAQVVGDDGPTPSNPYNGPARVYALTCDDQGQLRNENT